MLRKECKLDDFIRVGKGKVARYRRNRQEHPCYVDSYREDLEEFCGFGQSLFGGLREELKLLIYGINPDCLLGFGDHRNLQDMLDDLDDGKIKLRNPDKKLEPRYEFIDDFEGIRTPEAYILAMGDDPNEQNTTRLLILRERKLDDGRLTYLYNTSHTALPANDAEACAWLDGQSEDDNWFNAATYNRAIYSMSGELLKVSSYYKYPDPLTIPLL